MVSVCAEHSYYLKMQKRKASFNQSNYDLFTKSFVAFPIYRCENSCDHNNFKNLNEIYIH